MRAGPGPRFHAPEISALRLGETADAEEYLREFMRLLRSRDAVDTLPFAAPRRPGLFGALMARFRCLLWRLLRYQHDRIAFRQNMVNFLLRHALELEIQARERGVAEIGARLAELERRLSGCSDRGDGKA